MNTAVINSLGRITVCLLVAPVMYWPLWHGHRYAEAIVGYGLAIAVYWAIQSLTRFRHPFNGALVSVVLAVIYSIFAALTIAIGGLRDGELPRGKNINNPSTSAPVNLPAIAAATETNRFSDPTRGLSIVKAPGWMFLTLEQHIETLKTATLKDAERLNRERERPSPPLVGILKYREPFDDVNPNLKIFVGPVGSAPTNDLPRLLGNLVSSRQRNLGNFRVIIPPENTTLSGCPSAHTKFYFDLEASDGRRFPAWAEIWIMVHKDQFVIVGLELRQDEKTGNRAEFDPMLQSLKLE